VNAFVAAETSLFDFENRVRLATSAANEPFLFCTGSEEESFTGILTWSLKGFQKALETVAAKALEFHNRRGDFASWAEHSLKDTPLKEQLKAISESKVKGAALRTKLVAVVKKRFDEISQQVQEDTKLF
jgi:hypothetical protein